MNPIISISPYVSAQVRQKALTGLCDQNIEQTLDVVSRYFQPLQKPKSGQWLAQHPSNGQSYQDYNLGTHHKVSQARKTIYILPLENDIQKSFLQLLRKYCLCFYYPLNVQLLESSDKILTNVKSRINSGVKQYHAGQILQNLKKQLKKDAFCMIGISITDLYPRESWNYVFGLASLQGRTGVFSFARHDDRFYEYQKYQIDYNKILWRSIGTLVHQIGHMFGIKHCIYYRCIMNGSNDPSQAAKKPLQLCPICLKKLQSNIKFNIKQRYEKIQQFLNENLDENRLNKKGFGLYEMITKITKDLEILKFKQKKVTPQNGNRLGSLIKKEEKAKQSSKNVLHKSLSKN